MTEADETQSSEMKPNPPQGRCKGSDATSKVVRRSVIYSGGKLSSQAVQRERHHILKLFLGLQVTGLVTGAVVASAARLDLLAGVGLGLSMGSLNFGLSLTLSSRD